MARQRVEPVAPYRALPVVVEVREPVGRLDQWGAGAARTVGDAHAVRSGAEADALLELWRRVRDANAALRTFANRSLDDVRHDAEADAVHGADDPLSRAVVTDGLARVLDAGVERGGSDVAMPPDAVEQLLLRDEAVAIGEQIREHDEHLGLDVQPLSASTQLVDTRVELVLPEGIDHALGRGSAHLIAQAPRERVRGVQTELRLARQQYRRSGAPAKVRSRHARRVSVRRSSWSHPAAT